MADEIREIGGSETDIWMCWKNGEDAGGSQDGRSIWALGSGLSAADTKVTYLPLPLLSTTSPHTPTTRAGHARLPCVRALSQMLRALLIRNRRSSSATLPSSGGWWGKFGGKGGGKKETPPPPPPPPPAPMTPAAAPNMALTRQRLLTLVFGDMETVRMVCHSPHKIFRSLIRIYPAPTILCRMYSPRASLMR